VCGDHLAERFMDEEARALFRRFEGFAAPNASNAARHRIVDDLVRERLAADPELPVVLLGAGFDTRAFRLEGGRWLEVDQPALIDLKNRILPADGAPNPLLRIPVEFGRDDVHGKLAAWCEGASPGVVVMEGVSMYLSPQQLGYTLAVLHRLLPRHTLICDLMTKDFARATVSPCAASSGSWAAISPPRCWTIRRTSWRREATARRRLLLAGRAVQHGSVKITRWLFNTLLRRLRDGYRLHVFEAGA